MKILIVDDEFGLNALPTKVLRKNRVKLVRDGEGAVALVKKAVKIPYSVILLDCAFKGIHSRMQGPLIAKKLREILPRTNQIESRTSIIGFSEMWEQIYKSSPESCADLDYWFTKEQVVNPLKTSWKDGSLDISGLVFDATDEVRGVIHNILIERSTPLACECYMCPGVAIDPIRNIALIVEEYQETHSELRMIEVRYSVSIYDIAQNQITQNIFKHEEKTGPGSGSDTYRSTKFHPIFDVGTRRLCLTTEKCLCKSNMEVLDRKEEKRFF